MSSPAVRRSSKIVARGIAALAAVVLLLGSAPTAMAARGAFVTSCGYSHSLMDDPIVFPQQPGASHLHDFFGNETTDATSTMHSLRAGTTRCLLRSDTAAYWMPTGFLGGTRVEPDRVRAYYFGIAKGKVETIPARLEMIAGSATATSSAENPHVHWFCGAAQQVAVATPLVDHPYDCTRYARHHAFVDGVVAKVDFPNCWDGVGTATTDVAYASHGCPDGFPHVIPRLILRIHYGIMDPCAGATPCRADDAPAENIALTFSSGSYVTYHADFWNAWHGRPLARFVRVCLDAHIDCGGLRTRDL